MFGVDLRNPISPLLLTFGGCGSFYMQELSNKRTNFMFAVWGWTRSLELTIVNIGLFIYVKIFQY